MKDDQNFERKVETAGVYSVFKRSVFSDPIFACSRENPFPSAKEIFVRNQYVFKGTITKAEVIDLAKVAPEILRLDMSSGNIIKSGGFFTKIYWHVDKIYKGKLRNNQYGVAVTMMCDPVVAKIGLPYIFSISPFVKAEGPDAKPWNKALHKIFEGSLGKFDPDGTVDEAFDQVGYKKLEAEFETYIPVQ